MIEPMSRQIFERLELVPQALVEIPAGTPPPTFRFETGEDDLAPFQAAPLMLDGRLPFALFRYETSPAREYEIRLPDTVGLEQVPVQVRAILESLHIPVTALKWQRERADTPF